MRGRFFLYIGLIGLLACNQEKKISSNFNRIVGSKSSILVVDSSVFKSLNVLLPTPSLEFGYQENELFGFNHFISLRSGAPNNLLIEEPTFITQHDNSGILYYVYPNSKLTTFQNLDGFIEMKDLEGSTIRNTELNFFRNLYQRYGRLTGSSNLFFYEGENQDQKFEELESKISIRKENLLLFLDSVSSEIEITPAFTYKVKNLIHYIAIYDSIELYFNWKNYLLARDNLYQNRLASLLSNLNALSSKKPTYFFPEVCRAMLNLLRGYQPTKRLIISNDDFQDDISIIKQLFQNSARDFLLADKYLLALDKKIIDEASFTDSIKTIESPYIRKLVKQRYKMTTAMSVKKFGKSSNTLVGMNNKLTSIEKVIRKYKGKVIYIDLWASWCEPCRNGFQYLKLLESKYSPAEIIFLTISIDKAINIWKVAAFAEKLNFNNAFLLPKWKVADFFKDNKIETIPRYILVDKSGKIADGNALSPLDTMLVNKMDALLK